MIKVLFGYLGNICRSPNPHVGLDRVEGACNKLILDLRSKI
jgi:hypothetical protein